MKKRVYAGIGWKLWVAGMVFTILTGCGASKPFYSDRLADWKQLKTPDSALLMTRVYLLGNTGTSSEKKLTQNLNTIQHLTTQEGNGNRAVENKLIFLGDAFDYKKSNPPASSLPNVWSNRLTQYRQFTDQLNAQTFVMAGHHSTCACSAYSVNQIKQQQIHINELWKDSLAFQPTNSCQGPTAVEVNNKLVFVFIDSHWWLSARPQLSDSCVRAEHYSDLTLQLEKLFQAHANQHIVLFTYHPLFNQGNHGGNYSLKDHLFPLTLNNPGLWLPLPIIGSLMVLYHKYGGNPNDLAHPLYQGFRNAVLTALENQKHVVVASALDKNLQYTRYQELNQLLVGTTGQKSHISKNSEIHFGAKGQGFMRLNYYADGSCWLEAWVRCPKTHKPILAFRYPLYGLEQKEQSKQSNTEGIDSVMHRAAIFHYEAGRFKRFWMGDHYRRSWMQQVKAPVLNLKQVAGGLSPERKGGGIQTTSLRLKDSNQVNYVLRVLDKNPGYLLPEGFRKTFAETFLQDQMSSGFPYGPLMVQTLAQGLQLYHTKPALYYVPYRAELGPYIQDVGGTLSFLEVRPDKYEVSFPEFGNAETVISTGRLYDRIHQNANASVDQHAFLKARLFDMWIGDWDRHNDQWRWAGFKEDGKTRFVPIARDRDQAFVNYDGVIPRFITIFPFARNLSSFRSKFNDVAGLNLSGSILDKTLLNKLSDQDWDKMAAYLQTKITDSLIESAIQTLPPEIKALEGTMLERRLKSRRSDLPRAAKNYYRILSKSVEVVGTADNEVFEIKRLNNHATVLKVYSKKKNGNSVFMYERTFDNRITKEIQLWGLSGNDEFKLTGKTNKGPLVRIIGGAGADVLLDSAHVSGLRRKTIVYDTRQDQSYRTRGHDTKIVLFDKPEATEYTTHLLPQTNYNWIFPALSFEFNEDDGAFLGGGLAAKTFAFRKRPASEHKLLFKYASNTSSFSSNYQGYFNGLFGAKRDLVIEAHAFVPKFVLNYFGEGNATANVLDIDFYRIRLVKYDFFAAFQIRPNRFLRVGIGPTYEYNEVRIKESSFLLNSGIENLPQQIKGNQFAGLHLFALNNQTNSERFPTQGVKWTMRMEGLNGLGQSAAKFIRLSGNIAWYFDPKWPLPLSFAYRLGGATNFGTYNFYQANFLGGYSNLRGFRNSRFAGRTSVYQNAEMRLQLDDFTSHLFNGQWGLMGFADAGRVWAKGDKSSKIHIGYGPGVYLYLFKQFLLAGYYGFSPEGSDKRLFMGFLF